MTNDVDINVMIDKTADWLKARGIYIPAEYKRRDPREPGRKEKHALEDKLQRRLRQRFNGQRRRLRKYMEFKYPDRKARYTKADGDRVEEIIENLPGSIWDDPNIDKKVGSVLLEGLNLGTDLFLSSVPIGIDAAGPRTAAIKWLNTYITGDEGAQGWFDLLDQTTQQALRNTLFNFVGNRAVTVNDVMFGLSGVFEDYRLERIAVTELTRMFAQGQQLAGEALAQEHEGVTVIKTWFANQDDLVCPICGPLNGKSVKINAEFTGGDGKRYFNPPAHVNCRCWTQSRTDILDDIQLQQLDKPGGFADGGT